MATAETLPLNRTNPDPNQVRRNDNGNKPMAESGSDDLNEQISQLQKDLKSIAATVTSLAEEKVAEAQSMAKKEVGNLAKAGANKVEEVQDEFSHMEKQLKDTIRQKPLTAVAGALALGFLLAVISR
jgi:ElaB/YqjD/DUF883 family membrane-anchored ribosome-binding protein